MVSRGDCLVHVDCGGDVCGVLDAMAQQQEIVTFVVVCDWRSAIAPPASALKVILKILGRTFNAKCLSCDVKGGDNGN